MQGQTDIFTGTGAVSDEALSSVATFLILGSQICAFDVFRTEVKSGLCCKVYSIFFAAFIRLLSLFLSVVLTINIPAFFVRNSTGASPFSGIVPAFANRHTVGFDFIVRTGCVAILLESCTASSLEQLAMIATARPLLGIIHRIPYLVLRWTITISSTPVRLSSMLHVESIPFTHVGRRLRRGVAISLNHC